MEYTVALSKAWSQLKGIAKDKKIQVRFLADEYTVDLHKEKILSMSCNVPAPDFVGILVLHYLISKAKGLPPVRGEWISFKELAGGIPYYPAFKKRAIEPILKKYGNTPQALLQLSQRFKARKIDTADAGIVLDVFEGVPVLITLWRGDEEFGPEASILFDRSIENIFCTEDIAVLAGVIAHNI